MGNFNRELNGVFQWGVYWGFSRGGVMGYFN